MFINQMKILDKIRYTVFLHLRAWLLFQYLTQKVGRYFMRNGVRLIPEGLGLTKAIAEFGGFTFFGQHKSVGGSVTFRVSAYNQDRLISEEIQQIR